MKFMSLPDEFSGEESQVVILPVSYEKNVTYGKGASKGPAEIINASQQLEYYDEEIDFEAYEKGIFLAERLDLCDKEPVEAIRIIADETRKYASKFFVGLGGDHSVTNGFVQGLRGNYSDLSVLIFDAHSDLRYSWNNSIWNHACVSRRLAKKHKVGIVGVRSMDKSEQEFLDSEEGKSVKLVKAYELSEVKIKDVLNHLSDNVFVSIDVDVFDPSFIRNTGTPEPGGLSWHQIITILKKVFETKNVVGCDIVEFAPVVQFDSEAYALAKLIYKIIGYKFKK
ncbi:agmatinase [Candidatus Woesearchaeota archaeon CG10_big_fil_rev_8_21_14_0_10_37_12]|nr:MAG: agmatinase [Candidatus Woesearchaeota archaeon CG10_big_fil_rev_8_21_14_0_10_37_12]